MIRHRFPPGTEPKVLTADLCDAYGIECVFRGGTQLCPGVREFDPEFLEGADAEGKTVFCICACHMAPKDIPDA